MFLKPLVSGQKPCTVTQNVNKRERLKENDREHKKQGAEEISNLQDCWIWLEYSADNDLVVGQIYKSMPTYADK